MSRQKKLPQKSPPPPAPAQYTPPPPPFFTSQVADSNDKVEGHQCLVHPPPLARLLLMGLPLYAESAKRNGDVTVRTATGAQGLLPARTRPQGGRGAPPPPPLQTPKWYGTMGFVGAGAGDFVLGIWQGEIFLFDPMCLYSKYSECGEFKNGSKTQKRILTPTRPPGQTLADGSLS